MTIRQLKKILSDFREDTIVDMACDEEGNYYGDISDGISVAKLKNGKSVITLYPQTMEMGNERYL